MALEKQKNYEGFTKLKNYHIHYQFSCLTSLTAKDPEKKFYSTPRYAPKNEAQILKNFDTSEI